MLIRAATSHRGMKYLAASAIAPDPLKSFPARRQSPNTRKPPAKTMSVCIKQTPTLQQRSCSPPARHHGRAHRAPRASAFRSKGSDRSRLPVAAKIALPIAGTGATPGSPIPLGSAVEGTILNDYSDAIVSAIHEHGGDVLKLIGDGTLAIFTAEDRTHACGAPLSAAIAAHERRMDRLPISSWRRA